MTWFQKGKPSAKHPLANLPMITDGETQVAEHDAVIRYIAKRFKPDLMGYNDAEYGLVESFFCYITKLKVRIIEFVNKPEAASEESKVTFMTANKGELVKLDAYAAGKTFLVGEHLTIADIYLYEVIAILRLINEATTNELKNLVHLTQ